MTREYGVIPLDRVAGLDGLAQLRAVLAGDLPSPPMTRALDFTMASAEFGVVVFEGVPKADYYNPLGTVHAGWAATLLDSAMACAAHSILKPGQVYTTLEFKLNFVRPITASTGRVRCEGRIVSSGARVATSEGRLLDAAGRLLAHGTETCLIFAAPAKPPA